MKLPIYFDYQELRARLWMLGTEPPPRPLVRYILNDMRTEFESGGYRFMVPKAQ
jgi:hypothetical protein